MIRPMTFLVYGFAADRLHVRESVATFFDQSAAIDFVLHPERDGFEKRNLYVSAGRYDDRASGYRPAEKPGGYEEWLIEIGRDPQTNRPRIAA